MDVLKYPQLSSLARKRVFTTNAPPTGKRRCKSTNNRKTAISVKPQQRVEDFKKERICVFPVGNSFAMLAGRKLMLKKAVLKIIFDQSSIRMAKPH